MTPRVVSNRMHKINIPINIQRSSKISSAPRTIKFPNKCKLLYSTPPV